MQNAAWTAMAAIWLGTSFWYAGGRKLYYDAQVEAICAKDGGVRVYETVKLPAERFDKWGNVGVPNKQFAKPFDEYHYELDSTYIREGDPTIMKFTTRIIRHSDRKILGVSVRYGRGGGDLPGPWHPSTFECPAIGASGENIETSIFKKGE